MAAEHVSHTNGQVLAPLVSGMSGCNVEPAQLVLQVGAVHTLGMPAVVRERPSQLLGDVAVQQPVQLLLQADVGVVTVHLD